MLVSRSLFVAAAIVLATTDASAQARSDFDTLAEGTVAVTLLTPAGTFQDLVLDAQGTPGVFAVDAGSASVNGLSGFSAPNVLSAGAWTPGPTLGPAPAKSFRILLSQPSSYVRIGFFIDSLPPPNQFLVVFYAGAQYVSSVGVNGTGASNWYPFPLEVCGNGTALIDEIRVSGNGPVDGGRFRAAVDTLVIANAPCSGAPAFCSGLFPGGCPCGNQPSSFDIPSAGCTNSFGHPGFASAQGLQSLTIDETQVGVSGLPPYSTGVLLQSSATTTPTAFGDGLSCLANPVTRVLFLQAGPVGNAFYPLAGQAPLSVRAGLTTPGPRHYQLMYRNMASFCTPSAYNLTNGFTIAWGP